MKAKPRHLTVLSPKKFLYPVKKFPRALWIVKDPIFLITRYIIGMDMPPAVIWHLIK
jgi:hypothetical protein